MKEKKLVFKLGAKNLRTAYRTEFVVKYSKEDVERLYNKDPEVYDAKTNTAFNGLWYCESDIWEHPLEWYFGVDEEDLEKCRKRASTKLGSCEAVMLMEQGFLTKEQLFELEDRDLLAGYRLKTLDDWYGYDQVLSPKTIEAFTEERK